MRTLLLAFLLDGFLPVLLIFVGLGLIFGIISRQRAINLVGIIVLFALLCPFVYALFDHLSLWLLLLITAGFIVCIGRVVLNAFFGKGATDHFVGQVMFAMFALPFRLLGAFFRRRRS
ncbi:MAG: hypothetical protein IBX72_11470 [Nitrospirae bacterium]|nr:hypothetical protein [Nitrospirota bacterium]